MPGPSVLRRARALAGRTARVVVRAAVAPLVGSAPFAEAELLKQEADELRDQVQRLEERLVDVLAQLQEVADRVERQAE